MFLNETSGANVVASGNHSWNTSYYELSGGTNVVGNSFMGGNYWYSYSGVDNGNATYTGAPNVSGDFVGDTLIPHNDTRGYIDDLLPLVGADCQEVTGDLTLTGNLSVNSLSDGEACYLITGDDIMFNLAGFTVEGNGDECNKKVQDASNVTIYNGVISGFDIGVYIDPSLNITVANVTVNDSTWKHHYT